MPLLDGSRVTLTPTLTLTLALTPTLAPTLTPHPRPHPRPHPGIDITTPHGLGVGMIGHSADGPPLPAGAWEAE